jgi:hypothetical protein
MSILAGNAKDIVLDAANLCLVLGYMASPNRVGYIEAQIPEDTVHVFLREFPNAPYYMIKQGETTGGNVMKQGCQLRIYFNNVDNCPPILAPYLGVGTGKFVKRINKGRFVESVVKNYGFAFGTAQSEVAIRAAVGLAFPRNINDFEAGYRL